LKCSLGCYWNALLDDLLNASLSMLVRMLS
jgi:hypothetical protein